MFPNLVPVQTGYSFVIRGSEIHEKTLSGLQVIVEIPSVPYRSLIIIQFLTLRIPVAGDLQGLVSIEIVFIEDCPVFVEIAVGKIRS